MEVARKGNVDLLFGEAYYEQWGYEKWLRVAEYAVR